MERMIVQHLRTDVSGKKPSPNSIMDGELVINYAANDETLYIKNSDEEIAEFKDNKYYKKQLNQKVDKTLLLTYSELVSLRDNSHLIPGQQYRITDYTCTTTTSGTTSAGHIFDIIVIADSESVLNEEARAIQHEGDTYFANCDLNAWKLWYCLDNYTTRFEWADTTNGKGVIYRMIDEFNNDVPYDFKNIQFYRQWDSSNSLWSTILSDNTGVPCYTFSSIGNSSTTSFTDISLNSSNSVYFNVIKDYISNNKQTLNNNCFFGNVCQYNSFGNNCYNNSFRIGCQYNSFGSNCYNNSFGISCQYNSFGNGCQYNSFGSDCYNNSFGNGCQYNSFGNGCQYNSFGNNCYGNSFGNGCYSNSFGNDCYGNSFGNGCNSNSFGNECYSNSFGNGCNSNSFGNECYSNSFRVSADGTSILKDYVQYNHFDDGCSYNVIWNSDTTSSSILLKNININRGIVGTDSSHNMINIDVLNQDYEIQVAKNSKGEIKVYCEADLIA